MKTYRIFVKVGTEYKWLGDIPNECDLIPFLEHIFKTWKAAVTVEQVACKVPEPEDD